MRLAAAGHAQVIRQTLRMTALAEIGIYRDVSLAVMAHLGRILGWLQPKAAALAASIRAGHASKRVGGLGQPGRVAVRTGDRVRPASRRGWPWVWALASRVVVAAAAIRALAAGDVRAAFAHAGGLRVSWLGVAFAAEVASLASGAAAAAVCRQCIAALADRVWRSDRIHRAGHGDAGRAGRRGRLAGRRNTRRRGAGAAAGLRAVLAGGFASTVAVSGLLLTGSLSVTMRPADAGWLRGR